MGRSDLIRNVLLPAGADANLVTSHTGQTPCHLACVGNQSDVVVVLLRHGADPNRAEKGTTPCFEAAIRGSTVCLQVLAEGAAQQGRAAPASRRLQQKNRWWR